MCRNAKIAAGLVVTKDIPPHAVVAGVPVAIIKSRLSQEIINRLLTLERQWWDWDEKEIKENINIFTIQKSLLICLKVRDLNLKILFCNFSKRMFV